MDGIIEVGRCGLGVLWIEIWSALMLKTNGHNFGLDMP